MKGSNYLRRHVYCCLPPTSHILLVSYLIVSSLVTSSVVTTLHNHGFVADYTGDVMLGAVFPIHERDGLGCGKLQLEEGIQMLEALIYTVNKINNNPQILRGFTVGVAAIDSCDNSVHALEQSLDFIKGFIVREMKSDDEASFVCTDGTRPRYQRGRFDKVVGMIGGQSSAVSIQLAQLLRLFQVPQISYLSTSPTLSNRDRFGYFFRTVPSDVNQAHAMLEILKKFGWKYAAVVYSDSDYGNRGYETLVQLAPSYGVCFSIPQRVSLDHFGKDDYNNIVKTLLYKTKAKVVVVFADKIVTKNLMLAVKRYNTKDRFVWIGSDAWGGRQSVVEKNEDIIEGAISVQPLIRPITGFDEYFKTLRQSSNKINPWFTEYWEEHFKCEVQERRHLKHDTNYPYCKGDEKITSENGYKQQSSLHFVRDAAYAFAFALDAMHRDKCKGEPGLCSAMSPIKGEVLKKYLQQVSFRDEAGMDFKFLPSGDGPPRYSIMNFQKMDNHSFDWKVVGTYSLGEKGLPELVLNRQEVKFKHDIPDFPKSYCSEPCQVGQAKIQLEVDTCCWVCRNCSEYQHLEGSVCTDCPNGTRPKLDRSKCIEIEEEYVGYEHPWAIGTMSFAGLGICLTIMVTVVFWVYSETPIVKASGRELSYLLLAGIFMSFALTFIIVAKPSPWTCGLTRFFLGFCYTLCYAAIVTKVNRISRIFNHSNASSKKTKYTSPQSQLVITTMLVSVEIIINGTWLIYNVPKTKYTYPKRDQNILICTGSEGASHLVGLIYPFILICFCTVFAFKTRKCPEGFNEARYVTFTNYTTFVIWLAFVPLFFLSASNHVRVVTLSFALSLGGMVQLACLFLPKIYVAVLKPEKNTRQNVMYSHRSTIHSSSMNAPQGFQGLQNGGVISLRMGDRSPRISLDNSKGSTVSTVPDIAVIQHKTFINSLNNTLEVSSKQKHGDDG